MTIGFRASSCHTNLVYYLLVQALNTFGSALQSGQLGPLMSQFGLGQQAVQAANEGGKFIFHLEAVELIMYVYL